MCSTFAELSISNKFFLRSMYYVMQPSDGTFQNNYGVARVSTDDNAMCESYLFEGKGFKQPSHVSSSSLFSIVTLNSH